MAAAITESELEVVAILHSLSEFIHDTRHIHPYSSINSIHWGVKKRRSTVTAQDARCKPHHQIDSSSLLPHFGNSPSPPPPPVTLELSPALSEIHVGQKKTSGLVAAELEEAAAGTGSPVSPLYFDQLRECADHRRKAPSPSSSRPLKRSRVQHKDWVKAQTNEISRLREEHHLLTQKAEAVRIQHEALFAENLRLKELRSRISSHQRSQLQLLPSPPPRQIETISFPIERKPSPSPAPAPEPEPKAESTISSVLFANFSRQRVEIPRHRVEIPDLNCYQEPSPAPQPPRGQARIWVAPPLERHLYRFEGTTPEEKRAATAAARRRRVEIKRRKAAAAAAVAVTAVPAAV